MNIFISGSSKEIERCEHWRDEVIKAGYFISCDWMADVRALGDDDAKLNNYRRLELAIKDRRGVKNCNLFWLLLPETEGAGCFVELGMAIQMNKPIIISGRATRTIFEQLANNNFALDEVAFENIRKWTGYFVQHGMINDDENI